ncbi:MAG: PLP-dependent aminotransferase family protein, partial [Pseudomonadales bacterium]|nr:PLP-dependent aminotransferase family protein [Pseudomonadales bacterium]
VTDPRGFLTHQQAYFEHLAGNEGLNDADAVPEYLRESYSYTDTLGPRSVRETFARAYGNDWRIQLDADRMVPTVGATGGINLVCSMFERPGTPVAYITDAPTYAGFLARSALCHHARVFSVEMDDEGPLVDVFVSQIRAAREAGYEVPLYYTVPDGHNPAGFSFSQSRREQILAAARAERILIVEDAPYVYINYTSGAQRTRPFFAMAPEQTVHLFTGSKIGFPGPRVGFLYSEAKLAIAGGVEVDLTEFAVTEASADMLFQNPAALYGFEALLHRPGEEGGFAERGTFWELAEGKLAVYREMRQIMLEGLERGLGAWPEHFGWTHPDAGFFTVFTFRDGSVRTDEAFTNDLVTNYGVVAIPMYDFYPEDARDRDANAGFDQLRLSFCFSESAGEDRRRDLTEAVDAFCAAVREMFELTRE